MIDGGLRPLFHQRMPEALWQAIETGGTGRGIPDSWYCFPGGVTGWCEFKVTKNWAVAIRPEQIGWALGCDRRGGRTLVFVRRKALEGPRRREADELWAIPPRGLEILAGGGLKALPDTLISGMWAGGPGRWDWDGVRKLLKR